MRCTESPLGERFRLGFFLAIGGFTKGFVWTAGAYDAAQGILVVPINESRLEELVLADARGPRNEVLKRFYQDAALRTGIRLSEIRSQ